MPAISAGTVSPDSSTAVTARPSLRASRRASDRRLPFQFGTGGSAAASASFFVDGGGVVVAAEGGGTYRVATVNFVGGGAGAGGADLLGAGFGSDAAGTDGDRGFAALASSFVMTMKAVAVTARKALVRMMVFSMSY